MNERIKAIRLALDLSQDEFGRRLGVTRGAITNIELNKVEPKPLFVDLICREFHVNEHWLRTGEGQMFVTLTPDEELSEQIGKILFSESDDFKKRFISALLHMDESGWIALKNLVEELKKDPG